jgi:hypothetical protein
VIGNPLRWICNRDGCFNTKKRPKIEVFSECFGNGINFGDVDGIVERKGHFLLLEWKGSGAISVGQRRLHDALLRVHGFAVVVVFGDPETMTVAKYVLRWRDKSRSGAGLDSLKDAVARWYRYADKEKSHAG